MYLLIAICLGKRSLQKNSTTRTVVASPNFMYIPLYVVKNLLVQAKVASKPENDTNTSGEKKVYKNTKLVSNTDSPFYIKTKQGKRYLVVNPNSKFLENFSTMEQTPERVFTHESNFQNNLINPNNMANHQVRNPYYENVLPFKHSSPFYGNSLSLNQNFHQDLLPQTQSYQPLENTISPNADFLGEHKEMQPMSFRASPLEDKRPVMINGFKVLQGDINQEGIYKGYVAIPFSAQLSKEQNSFIDFRLEGPAGETPDYQSELPESLSAFEKITAKQPTFSGYFYKDPVYNPHTSEEVFRDESTQQNPHATNPLIANAENQELAKSLQFSNIVKQYRHSTGEKTEGTLRSSFFNEQNYRQNREDSKYRYENAEDKNENPYVYTKEHVGFGPITVEAKTENAPMNDDDER